MKNLSTPITFVDYGRGTFSPRPACPNRTFYPLSSRTDPSGKMSIGRPPRPLKASHVRWALKTAMAQNEIGKAAMCEIEYQKSRKVGVGQKTIEIKMASAKCRAVKPKYPKTVP